MRLAFGPATRSCQIENDYAKEFINGEQRYIDAAILMWEIVARSRAEPSTLRVW